LLAARHAGRGAKQSLGSQVRQGIGSLVQGIAPKIVRVNIRRSPVMSSLRGRNARNGAER
jgi:hypothetical protein